MPTCKYALFSKAYSDSVKLSSRIIIKYEYGGITRSAVKALMLTEKMLDEAIFELGIGKSPKRPVHFPPKALLDK